MSKIDTTLSSGLCGADLDALVSAVKGYPAKNKVAWFSLLSVLKRVQAEWQDNGDQGIPLARAEQIDQHLLPIIRHFCAHTLDSSFASSQADLERLIDKQAILYFP